MATPVLSTPSGPTSVAYWQPDEEAVVCRVCSSEFSLLNRRHHCRVCGYIFCDSCCPVRDGSAFDPPIAPQRTCAPCWDIARHRDKLERSKYRTPSAAGVPPRRGSGRPPARSTAGRTATRSFVTPTTGGRRRDDRLLSLDVGSPGDPPAGQQQEEDSGSRAARARRRRDNERATAVITDLLARLQQQTRLVQQLESDRAQLRLVCSSLRRDQQVQAVAGEAGKAAYAAAHPVALRRVTLQDKGSASSGESTTPLPPRAPTSASAAIGTGGGGVAPRAVAEGRPSAASASSSDSDADGVSLGELFMEAYPECAPLPATQQQQQPGQAESARSAEARVAVLRPRDEAAAPPAPPTGPRISPPAPQPPRAPAAAARQPQPPPRPAITLTSHCAACSGDGPPPQARHVCSHLLSVTFDAPGPTGLVLVPSLSAAALSARGGNPALAAAVDAAVQRGVGFPAVSTVRAGRGGGLLTTVIESEVPCQRRAPSDDWGEEEDSLGAEEGVEDGDWLPVRVSVLAPARRAGAPKAPAAAAGAAARGGAPPPKAGAAAPRAGALWTGPRPRPPAAGLANASDAVSADVAAAGGVSFFDPLELLTDDAELSPFALCIGAVEAAAATTRAEAAAPPASPAQLHNLTALHRCCGRLRPGLLLVAVNGASVAGVGPVQLTHVLQRAPRPLRLTFLAHPLAMLRAQHARLTGRYHDLSSKAGRLATIFRRREAAAQAAAAEVAARIAAADALQGATAAALRAAQGEAAALRAQLGPLREALRACEATLSTYTGGALGSAGHAALAQQRRLTVARGSLAPVPSHAGPAAAPPPPPKGPSPAKPPAPPPPQAGAAKAPTAAEAAAAPASPPRPPSAAAAASAPLAALLAASVAVQPVTSVASDGVVTRRAGQAGGGGGGGGGVALFDPLFPDLQLTQAADVAAVSLETGRPTVSNLQRSIARAASEASVAAALAFLRRMGEGSAAVRGALADVLGWDLLDDPDNDGRGGSRQAAQAAAAASGTSERRLHGAARRARETLDPLGGIAGREPSRATSLFAPAAGLDPLDGGSGGGGASVLKAYSSAARDDRRHAGGAAAAAALWRPDTTALSVLQALVHRDAAVCAAEDALEEVRRLEGALSAAQREARASAARERVATALADELRTVLARVCRDPSAPPVLRGAAVQAEVLAAVSAAASAGLRMDALDAFRARPSLNMRAPALLDAAPPAAAHAPVPRLSRPQLRRLVVAAAHEEAARRGDGGGSGSEADGGVRPEAGDAAAFLSPGSAARPLASATGFDALTLWDRYKAVSQRADLAAAAVEEKDAALRALQRRCDELHTRLTQAHSDRRWDPKPPRRSPWHPTGPERPRASPGPTAAPPAPATAATDVEPTSGGGICVVRRVLHKIAAKPGAGAGRGAARSAGVGPADAPPLTSPPAASPAAGGGGGGGRAAAGSWDDDAGDAEAPPPPPPPQRVPAASSTGSRAPPPPAPAAAASAPTTPERAAKHARATAALQRLFRGRRQGASVAPGEPPAAASAAALAAPVPKPSASALDAAQRALDLGEAKGGADESGFVLEGLLQKRSREGGASGHWSAWAARYVRVGGGALRYYKSDLDVRPQGRAYLWELTGAVALGAQSFEVATKDGKAFQFGAPDAATGARWLGVLQAVVHVNRGGAAGGGAASPAAAPAAAYADDSDAD